MSTRNPDRSRPVRLTTTSFAVLGLLALRPWSSYDLTQQMTRSLDRFWPRAQSKLYEEPKKLVEHGLATAAKESSGGRTRTVYTITDEGRRALQRWLRRPAQPPQLESEQVLKVFLADAGTTADLRARLVEVRDWADGRLADDARIAQSYLDGEGPFPERVALLTMVGRFSWQQAQAARDWATWALDVVDGWPPRPGDAPLDRLVLEEIVAAARERRE